jgi:hypothetical protein
MKALCRRCRTVGPTIPSVAESKSAAEVHGWTYSKRNGFACPDCQGKPAVKTKPSRALVRAYRIAIVLEAAAFAALAVLVVLDIFL